MKKFSEHLAEAVAVIKKNDKDGKKKVETKVPKTIAEEYTESMEDMSELTDKIAKSFSSWAKGDMTEPEMIKPAKQEVCDLVKYKLDKLGLEEGVSFIKDAAKGKKKLSKKSPKTISEDDGDNFWEEAEGAIIAMNKAIKALEKFEKSDHQASDRSISIAFDGFEDLKDYIVKTLDKISDEYAKH